MLMMVMNAVVDFAKKTGDYASLSITDMKVIALTRMFEREHNGADHLRATPPLPTLVVPLQSSLCLMKKSSDEDDDPTAAQG